MYANCSHINRGASTYWRTVPKISRRVFVLGPSHHAYLDGCAVTKCSTYATPVGNLPIDHDSETLPLTKSLFQLHRLIILALLRHAAVKELEATRQFSQMAHGTDEDEHSIEV